MSQGPNMKRFICHRMAVEIVPPGSGVESVQNVVSTLTNKKGLVDVCRSATKWCEEAIAAVKSSPDNPYGDDDEAIAAELVRQIEEKKRNQLRQRMASK